MIQIIQGIEGNDIPYHLKLLNFNIDHLSRDIYFWPLNDHYNTHGINWNIQASEKAYHAKTLVFYDIVNIDDLAHKKFCNFVENFPHPNKIYLTVNQSPNLKLTNVCIVPWDFMWNRIRAYYTETIPESLYLHHYNSDQYHLPELDFKSIRTKKFLSLTGRNIGYRPQLFDYVRSYPGYVSNRGQGVSLDNKTGAFTPVSNNFYLDSYFSVYAESNCTDTNLIHITEKTFEPLLKGHFILPFSNPGTIKRIQDLGFLLPDFIDYSYDLELDPDRRFELFKLEFLRLLNLNLDQLYKEHKELLIHNQQCLHTICYDPSILQIFNV